MIRADWHPAGPVDPTGPAPSTTLLSIPHAGGITDDQGPGWPSFVVTVYVRGRGRPQCCGHAARQLDAPPPGCSDIQHRWTSRAWLSRTSPNRETVRRPEIAQHMDRYKSGPLAFPPRASRILASFFCQFAGHLLVRPFSEIGLRLASPFPPNIFMRLRAGNRHRPPNQT